MIARAIAAAVLAAGLLTASAAPALANAQPPTNGGNGAGQSGQCTGNPDDRPVVCPAT
jgi:opacity protein-like surface antigen